MKLVTSAEMRNIDNNAINKYHIPGIVLMENAGLAVVSKIREIFGDGLVKKKIMIFCGKGNNGGDGMVIARHLINRGVEVRVYLLGSPSDMKDDVAANLAILQSMGAKIHPIINDKDMHRAGISMMYADLIVDAIFGTGFEGEPKGAAARIIKLINDSKRLVLSVDIPSGLEADTGKIPGECINADYTITFGLAKIGLFMESGYRYSGKIEVADISLPMQLLNSYILNRELLTKKWIKGKLYKRNHNTHKGTYGHVLVIGGSPGMTGAVYLAATGALRAGAGLVTVAVPQSLNNILEQKLTEVMTLPLPEKEKGFITADALKPILDMAGKVDTIVIGPGMGVSDEGEALLKELLPQLKIPVVLDADGLNLLSKIMMNNGEFLKQIETDIICTPHPGEMARLCNIDSQEVQKDRLFIAEEHAKKWGATVVLKGSKTIVSLPGGRTYLNINGNPGMATGGTGDVLTGIIGAFAAQKFSIGTAAAIGVFLHGHAGDKAAEQLGEYSLTAMDIIDYLPYVLKELIEGE